MRTLNAFLRAVDVSFWTHFWITTMLDTNHKWSLNRTNNGTGTENNCEGSSAPTYDGGPLRPEAGSENAPLELKQYIRVCTTEAPLKNVAVFSTQSIQLSSFLRKSLYGSWALVLLKVGKVLTFTTTTHPDVPGRTSQEFVRSVSEVSVCRVPTPQLLGRTGCFQASSAPQVMHATLC